jgi:hypothetical protein
MVRKVILDGTFDGRIDDREYAAKVFERHTEEVKARVPEGRLLVYEVREGWGPLCEFLGVEAPEGPFPHLNGREEFPRMMRRQMVAVLAPNAVKVLAAASALLVALLALRLVLPGKGAARAQPVRLGHPAKISRSISPQPKSSE